MSREARALPFRKKPVTVQARQWLGGEYAWLDDFCGRNWTRADAVDMGYDDPEQVVVWNTAERQYLHVPVGHWLIRGVQGELYPCKPDIFEATYESADAPVSESAPAWYRVEKPEGKFAMTPGVPGYCIVHEQWWRFDVPHLPHTCRDKMYFDPECASCAIDQMPRGERDGE